MILNILKRAWTIIVIDNLSSGHIENLPQNSPDVIFIKGDITNPKDLDKVFQYPIEIVFHLAARFANQNSVENPIEDLDTNAKGTLYLLDYSKKNHIKRFIYTSSSCVYGSKDGELNESDINYQLETPYAISKLVGEYYVKFFQKDWNLNWEI